LQGGATKRKSTRFSRRRVLMRKRNLAPLSRSGVPDAEGRGVGNERDKGEKKQIPLGLSVEKERQHESRNRTGRGGEELSKKFNDGGKG